MGNIFYLGNIIMPLENMWKTLLTHYNTLFLRYMKHSSAKLQKSANWTHSAQ